LRAIEQSSAVPIYGRPKSLRCPGGVVAIVGKNNQILLQFKTAAIVGPTKVTLADGKSIPNGCVIRADRKTIRRPTKPSKVPIRGWYGLGAFRYFDFANMRAVVIGDERKYTGEYVDDEKSGAIDFTFHPLAKGIPGLSHDDPGAKLMGEYVAWMGADARFGRNYIREAKLHVDLFDLTHWQLIEAKVSTSRESIRMAIGQLRDYRRFYPNRHPSLAVLLASRPKADCVKLLTDNLIAVIWKTPRGGFKTKRWHKRTRGLGVWRRRDCADLYPRKR
jgi:hypothetical protein